MHNGINGFNSSLIFRRGQTLLGLLQLRDQAFIIKFKSAHLEYQDQDRLEFTPHKSSDLKELFSLDLHNSIKVSLIL